VTSLFTADPALVTQLAGLLRAEGAVAEDIRTLALRALAVQLLDRTRHGAVVQAVASGGQSSLLARLMHRSVESLAGEPGRSPLLTEALLSLVGALVSSTTGEPLCLLAPACTHTREGCAAGQPWCPPLSPCARADTPPPARRPPSLPGCQALSDVGLVPALLPLLSHSDPAHCNVVSSTVRILEAFMDFRWVSWPDLGMA
jgi:hypothetical protein